MQLNSENFDSYLIEIPIQDLPATFKDAIEITLALGIYYIWIDSLCINQSDQEGWLREAALMSSVYSGSYVNIAASSGRDVYQGCYLKPLYFSDGFGAKVTIAGKHQFQQFWSRSVCDRAVAATHLSTRAWTLQEQVLPSRTLHIGDRGMFWECRMLVASEFYPAGFVGQVGLYTGSLVQEESAFEKDYYWDRIVRIYSKAYLTYGQDKLPALSGIACVVFQKPEDEYLTGLWRRNIELHLCLVRLGRSITKKTTKLRQPRLARTNLVVGFN